MTTVIPSVETQKEVERRLPSSTLSGFSLAGLAYCWGSTIDQHLISQHRLSKEYGIAVDLGRRVQELSNKESGEGKRVKKDMQVARELLGKSEKLISRLSSFGITEPWLDWSGTDKDAYISHLALATAQSVRVVASAYVSRSHAEQFPEFAEIAKSSALAITYVVRINLDGGLLGCLPEQAKQLEDGYAMRLGNPVPKRKLKAIRSELSTIQESLPSLSEPVPSASSLPAALLTVSSFALSALVLVFAPKTTLISILSIAFVGVTGMLFLMLKARHSNFSKYPVSRYLFILAAFLFGGEAMYLIFGVLGIITFG